MNAAILAVLPQPATGIVGWVVVGLLLFFGAFLVLLHVHGTRLFERSRSYRIVSSLQDPTDSGRLLAGYRILCRLKFSPIWLSVGHFFLTAEEARVWIAERGQRAALLREHRPVTLHPEIPAGQPPVLGARRFILK